MPFDIFDHHDGIIDHDADAQHNGQEGQQIDREPGHLHEEKCADDGQGNGGDRHDHSPQRAHEEEDNRDNDKQCLGQSLEHFIDRVADVDRGIVADAALQAGRQVAVDFLQFGPHPGEHIQGIGIGQHPDPHEDGFLAGETYFGIIVLRAEHHVGHVLEPHDRSVTLADDQLFELFCRVEVGVGGQIDRDQRAFGLANGREIVVAGQGLADLRRTDIERGHPVGLEPDAHGKDAPAEDFGALYPGDGGEPRLDDTGEVVGDFVGLENVGGETEIGRGALRVGVDDIDDRHLGLGRQVVAHLVHFRADLGQGFGRIVIEFEPRGDDRATGRTLRLDVVDAVRPRDNALQRRGDEPPHQIGTRADVDRGHGDRGVVAARVLAHVEAEQSLQSQHDDEQSDHGGHHGPLDEHIGERARSATPAAPSQVPQAHESSGRGCRSGRGAMSLFT